MTDKFEDDEEILTGDNCPVCGYPLVVEYGEVVCYNCGYSENSAE